MTTTFAAATGVRPAGEGCYEADLRAEYAVGSSRPNGGYLLACLGRAALAAARAAGSGHQHVIAAGAQFFRSPGVGPARIDTTVLRAGRAVTQVSAAIGHDGGPGVQAQFTLATLAAASEPYWGGIPPVALPPIEECRPLFRADRRGMAVSFDPAAGFTITPDGPVATGGGEFRAWLRDENSGTLDPVSLLFAADGLPPATFGVLVSDWVPTLDLTVYVRALPAPGPIRLRFRALLIQDGFADEVCEGWDSAGRLVLQSTQLAALRLPPKH
ncbi:MAG: thioesterase family protein [Actinobacteria bacterium]|nr:thioesterase family protein [Actinomycetota bacterium]